MQSQRMARTGPSVSVLMPTYRQAAFIPRAIESLLAQTYEDWELVILDDGSPDETAGAVAPFLADARLRYVRLPRNRGLGASLNAATAQTRGRYLAYLPSDDVYYPSHLALLTRALASCPDVYLAYAGVRRGQEFAAPTLRGAGVVGHEAAALANPPPVDEQTQLPSGNILALVQVMHRREPAPPPWPERQCVVSDRLEPDYWRALLSRGDRFAYAGDITCEWGDHPDQRHKLIAGHDGGLARFRQFYGLGRGEWLNWQPSRGLAVDERVRFGRFATRRCLPAPGGLKILVAGELGYNPERIVAFEERGHKLFGLWDPQPETWDSAGPFPFGNIEDIPLDPDWPDRVRAARPDIIYGLINWQALPTLRAVLDADLGIPFVIHFKEGPYLCQERGHWATLARLLRDSDGQIFITDENRDWFRCSLGGKLDPEATHLLDGDPPKLDWMGNDWAPKLSLQDGEIHTVCAGRPIGLDPIEEVAANRIHVHFYGEYFHRRFPNWTRIGRSTGYVHVHPAVEPQDWVRTLSRYDAAWLHIFASANRGDIRRATWHDLNLPTRLGTYAAAGLPLILRDNRKSRVASQSLAQRHDVGIFFRDYADLAAQLRDRPRLAALTANMRAARPAFAFDPHVDDLIAFFRRTIARHDASRGG